MDEVFEWASKQAVVLPLRREFIEEIVNRATEKVQREALEYRKISAGTLNLAKRQQEEIDELLRELKKGEVK